MTLRNHQDLKNALILHTRDYRDTSLLIDFFTQDYGRISAVARGAKRPKSSWRGILQAFTPLLINYTGRHELLTLTVAEADRMAIKLTGNHLLSAFYLNELLVRLLERHDPQPELYNLYRSSLEKLAENSNKETLEIILRQFELKLLQELGYGLKLDQISANNAPICADDYYSFNIESGIILGTKRSDINKNTAFSGASLLAITNQDFSNVEILRDAKRLFRMVINALLGNKTLYSRQLFLRLDSDIN